jgi:hypothetical protein
LLASQTAPAIRQPNGTSDRIRPSQLLRNRRVSNRATPSLETRIALFSATEESQFLVLADVLIGVGRTSFTPWNEANYKIFDGK